MIKRLAADDRAVSTAVAYTLAIGITVVLVGGLFTSMAGLMHSSNDRAADGELRIVGEGIAVDIAKADAIHNDGHHAMRIDAGSHIAGSAYTIALDASCPEFDGECLRLATRDRDHAISLNLSHEVDNSTVQGGTMWIYVDSTDGTDGTIALQEERP